MASEYSAPLTTEQLKDLLDKVTPAPWWTDAKYDGAEKGCAIVAARTDCGPLPGNPTRGMVAWSSAILNTEARRCEANATLIALAPTLAAEVVRLREALEEIAIQDQFNCRRNGEIVPDWGLCGQTPANPLTPPAKNNRPVVHFSVANIAATCDKESTEKGIRQ